jgi:microcystin-dependent protein
MAQDATGTPSTNWGIPKYNTAADGPTGKGLNAIVDFIDGIIIPDLIFNAKGDIIAATGADAAARLAVGANDTVLTADSAEATGLRWGSGGGGVPAGALVAYGGTSAPSGWLLCDGTAVSRTGANANLFAAIGTAYGVGDGSTTFNLPDMRGRVPVGLGTHADVNTLGNSDGMGTVANRRPKHRHTAHTHGVPERTIAAGAGTQLPQGTDNATSGATTTTTATDGGSGNVNDSLDAPAYLVHNYIIKQ